MEKFQNKHRNENIKNYNSITGVGGDSSREGIDGSGNKKKKKWLPS